MCIISYRAVTVGSRYLWYLMSRTAKHKSSTVIDIYNTILQVGTQIVTLPELMLTTAVMAWGKILLLRRLYCILLRRRWGGLLIERRVELWTELLVAHMTVRQSRLLTVLGPHKTMPTDWRASRWCNTDYSQSYSRSRMDGTLCSRGRRRRRVCSNYRRGRRNLSCHGNCRGSLGSCGSEGSPRSQGRSRGCRRSR